MPTVLHGRADERRGGFRRREQRKAETGHFFMQALQHRLAVRHDILDAEFANVRKRVREHLPAEARDGTTTQLLGMKAECLAVAPL